MRNAVEGNVPKERPVTAKRRAGSGSKSLDLGPQSVARITGILELLALHPAGERLTDIGRALGAPKTSLVGLLKGLQGLDYIARKKDRYFLGPSARAFATSVIPGHSIVHLARPFLRQLAHTTGETALVGVKASSGDVAVYVDTFESDNPVRYTVPVGEPRELYCSAVGKCILAFFDDEQLTRYLGKHRLIAHTARTITSAKRLVEELKRIRSLGIATSEDERMVGVSAVAAPVYTRGTGPLAVFVIGAPTERFRANRRDYARAVVSAAKELSRIVGLIEIERLPKTGS